MKVRFPIESFAPRKIVWIGNSFVVIITAIIGNTCRPILDPTFVLKIRSKLIFYSLNADNKVKHTSFTMQGCTRLSI
jgi:hypothetical protein